MVESELEVGGAVVFWAAADGADRDKLRDGLLPLGLGRLAPDPRPPMAALKDAMEDVLGGPRVLVRPLAGRDGWAAVREDRGHAGNDYRTLAVARPDPADADGVVVDPPLRIDELAAAYRRHRDRVPAGQLSAALVRVVDALGGVRLRPGGAVYWLPGHRLDDWAAVGRAVEAAATGKPSAVYVLRHRLDADAVRAVRDAVVAEVRADAARVELDVATGELGTRALDARRKEAAALRQKVAVYEHLLSVGLDDLHAAVDRADQAAAAAALLLSAHAAASDTSPAVASAG